MRSLLDAFPLDMVRKMRCAVATMAADRDGVVTLVLPARRANLSMAADKSRTLALFDANIARRTTLSPEPTR